MNIEVKVTIEGQTFWCSARQASALQTLSETNKGGFARINGYVSESNRVSPETAHITVMTRFSVENLYLRKIKAIEAMTLADIKEFLPKGPSKLSGLSDADLEVALAERKATKIASMTKTLEGEREDARRQAHDRCYARVCQGVKVHYLTEKDADGIMQPVLKDGYPQVARILLGAIQISKQVVVEGEYKKVNSGVPVLLSNAMERAMPKSCKYKNLSLGDEKFESIAIDGDVIVPKETAGAFSA